MIVRFIIATAIIGCTALCATVSSYGSEAAGLSRPGVQEIVTPFVKRGEVIGLAVVAVRDGSPARITTYGESLKGSGRRPLSSTLFQIGSTTKTFTALLLATFLERRLVRFEDPVQKYMPAKIRLPMYHGKEISLLDLATHRSGLPRNPPMAKQQTRLSLDDMYNLLERVRLTREPGGQYEYSNWGF